MALTLKVVTPERTVVEETVDAVYAQAVDGRLGILPKHIPLVTPLDIGVLEYVKGSQKKAVAVMGGMLSTNGDWVTVLSEAAELGDEVDAARASKARERAETRLKEAQAQTAVDKDRAKRALARATVRTKLGGK